jgi:hypothetical protein
MSSVSPLPSPANPPVAQTAAASAQTQSTPSAPSNPNQRLVIQETGEVGVFIYTVIDRTTGQVITQLPCETVVDMARHPDYAAGRIVSTTA